MAVDRTEKAPPAKGDPATTAAVVDAEAAHPAPVPVPPDLPSHQYVHHQGVPVHQQGTAMGAPVAPQLVVAPVVVEQRVVGKRLKAEGWLAVCVLGFLFWPLMCVPCCLPQCQEDVVETVYIAPTQAPPVQFVQQP